MSPPKRMPTLTRRRRSRSSQARRVWTFWRLSGAQMTVRSLLGAVDAVELADSGQSTTTCRSSPASSSAREPTGTTSGTPGRRSSARCGQERHADTRHRPVPGDRGLSRCGGGLRPSTPTSSSPSTARTAGRPTASTRSRRAVGDRTPAEVATAFAERVRHLHCLAADGVCPDCAGRRGRRYPAMATAVSTCRSAPSSSASGVATNSSPVGLTLLDNSRVAAFYDDHGVDLSSRPYWRCPACRRPVHQRRSQATRGGSRSRSAAEAALTADRDGDPPVEFERQDCGH